MLFARALTPLGGCCEALPLPPPPAAFFLAGLTVVRMLGPMSRMGGCMWVWAHAGERWHGQAAIDMFAASYLGSSGADLLLPATTAAGWPLLLLVGCWHTHKLLYQITCTGISTHVCDDQLFNGGLAVGRRCRLHNCLHDSLCSLCIPL